MAILNLRLSQSSPLTAAQLDQNFINLNNELANLVDLQDAADDAAESVAAAAASAAAALVSENNAATSETNAGVSETNAATSETNAATSETNAATSETNAGTSETNAGLAETAAEAAQTAAEAALDEFDDIYLGSKTSNPTLDNDGNALQDGALYFNTTSNKVLVYDLGTTSWIDLAVATSNDTRFTAPTASGFGQIPVQNDADDGWQHLAQGTSGQLLQSNGANALPSFVAAPSSNDPRIPSPAASKFGAFIVQSTDDANYELLSGQGTSGQILTSNGADALPSFQAAPTSGDPRVLIADSGDISSVATVDFDDVFTSTYDTYEIVIDHVVPVTDAVFFQMRFGTSGNTYDSGLADYQWSASRFGVGDSATVDSVIELQGDATGMGNDVGFGASGRFYVYSPTDATQTMFSGELQTITTSTAIGNVVIVGSRKASASKASVRFFMSSGNVSTGRIRIYGLTNGTV
jgi:hypothetical protein